MTDSVTLDIEQIQNALPHRPPFLFVDRLTDIVANESAVGWKEIRGDEPFFQGHFPGYPVMPGVLIVEALAQTAGAAVSYTLGLSRAKRIVYFMTIEKARFRKPVRPGDLLRMPVKALKKRGPVWRYEGQAFVGDTLCAEAEFTAMIHDGEDSSEDSGAA
jgi:3-hydroxyacyl-[acyl-carrier-protein] dehydratase